MSQIYLSIGSNCDRENNIRLALKLLREKFGEIETSSIYRSVATNGEGKDYYNLVAAFKTDLSIGALRDYFREIEIKSGRDRSQTHRVTLDLDLLLYGAVVGIVDGVRLPHPDIEHCLHVIQPLAELNPTGKHPLSGLSFESIFQKFSQSLTKVSFE